MQGSESARARLNADKVMDLQVNLDLDSALDNLGGDHDLLCEIAQVFVEDVPSLIVNLSRAHQQRDYRTVRLLAHSLKGLCATFGAEPARSLAMALEQRMGEVPTASVSSELVDQLVSALGETIVVLKREVIPNC